MRIHIEKILRTNTGLAVEFISSLGTASVAWVGPEPKIKEFYEVEIDIDEQFKWGENIWESNERPHIASQNDIVSISAELLQYDSDGCAAIKLEDSVILIELSELPQPSPKSIMLKSARVKFYPLNI